MNMSSYVGSKFLGAADYPRPVVLIIQQISEETIGEDQKRKGILYFERVEKALVLNKVNTITLIELFGEESDNWVGQKIEVYTDPNVMFGGKRTPALRLRAPQQRTAPRVAAPQEQTRPGMAPANAVTDEEIADPGDPMTAGQRQAAGRTRAPF